MWAAACTQRQGVNFPFDDVQGDSAADTGVPATAEGYPCEQAVPDAAGRIAVTSSVGPLVVAHAVDGCYVANLRACTHEGVPIDYRPLRGQFVCPRHGAVYDWQGRKVAGPQPGGLPVYPVAREGDTVWVDVGQEA